MTTCTLVGGPWSGAHAVPPAARARFDEYLVFEVVHLRCACVFCAPHGGSARHVYKRSNATEPFTYQHTVGIDSELSRGVW